MALEWGIKDQKYNDDIFVRRQFVSEKCGSEFYL
jgi:hypothetical protein